MVKLLSLLTVWPTSSQFFAKSFLNTARTAMRILYSRHVAEHLVPTDPARIRQQLRGNLCRCTGYQNIVSAIRLAAIDEDSDQPDSEDLSAQPSRVEDSRLLCGQGTFTDDIDLPGQLYASFLRSEVASGEIKDIDLTALKELDGVSEVFTEQDVLSDGLICWQIMDVSRVERSVVRWLNTWGADSYDRRHLAEGCGKRAKLKSTTTNPNLLSI